MRSITSLLVIYGHVEVQVIERKKIVQSEP